MGGSDRTGLRSDPGMSPPSRRHPPPLPALYTEAFCDGHVSAFAFFDGMPSAILFDNTALAVAKILGEGPRSLSMMCIGFEGGPLLLSMQASQNAAQSAPCTGPQSAPIGTPRLPRKCSDYRSLQREWQGCQFRADPQSSRTQAPSAPARWARAMVFSSDCRGQASGSAVE